MDLLKKKYIYLVLHGFTFLMWYLVTAYYNVFACDDFWHGTNVHSYGFWGAQNYYWQNWEGSYFHTFFATIPHVFTFSKIPFFCNIFSFIILWYSFYLFFITYFTLSKRVSFFSSLFCIAWLYTFTTGNAEIRYWVCANLTYILGLACILLFFSVLRLKLRSKALKILILLLLLFLIIGNKISFIFSIYIFVLLYLYLINKLNWKSFFYSSIIIFIISLCNISAPGNYIRLELNNSEGIHMSIPQILFYRFIQLIPLLLFSLLLFPVSLFINLGRFFSKKNLLIFSIALIILYVGDSIIMYISFKDSGPSRCNLIIEFTLLLYFLYIQSYLWSKLNNNTLKLFFYFGGILIFTIMQIPFILTIPNTVEYSENVRIRNLKMIEAKLGDQVYVNKLPYTEMLLPYFNNDEGWLNNVYSPYYNKENVVIILENNIENYR